MPYYALVFPSAFLEKKTHYTFHSGVLEAHVEEGIV